MQKLVIAIFKSIVTNLTCFPCNCSGPREANLRIQLDYLYRHYSAPDDQKDAPSCCGSVGGELDKEMVKEMITDTKAFNDDFIAKHLDDFFKHLDKDNNEAINVNEFRLLGQMKFPKQEDLEISDKLVKLAKELLKNNPDVVNNPGPGVTEVPMQIFSEPPIPMMRTKTNPDTLTKVELLPGEENFQTKSGQEVIPMRARTDSHDKPIRYGVFSHEDQAYEQVTESEVVPLVVQRNPTES